jgi:putative GTP pyrophosphokinase
VSAESDAPPSKTKITEAGGVLRQFAIDLSEGRIARTEDGSIDMDALDPRVPPALKMLNAYRASFGAATTAIGRTLDGLIAEVAVGAQLTGRPKRLERIINKLVRFPTMRLAQMEDISGLRVKFPNGPSEVQALRERMGQAYPQATTIDYVAKPKPTGYRAIHMLVPKAERLVEVQLRTARQNRWADEVEAIDDRYGFGLKDGHGPPPLLQYFERAAYRLACEERGEPVDAEVEAQFVVLREQVKHYFVRPSGD